MRAFSASVALANPASLSTFQDLNELTARCDRGDSRELVTALAQWTQ